MHLDSSRRKTGKHLLRDQQPELASGVQDLLLRLGITASVRRQTGKRGQPQYHVIVSGAPDQLAFVKRIGGLGEQKERASAELKELILGRRQNTNRDVIEIRLADHRRASQSSSGPYTA